VPSILLARHAQGSFGGDDYDVLSETGHEQAAALAADLRRRAVRVDRVVSGTLLRQRDTAAPVAAALGVDVEIDGRWDEYDMSGLLGAHSASPARASRPAGSDAPALSSRDFQDVLEAALLTWIAAADDSPAAESWPAFAARVQAALRELAASLDSGEAALVCTSGGVLAAVCVELLGLERDPAQPFVRLNRVAVNAALTKVVAGRAGTTLVAFNEHGHLDGTAGLVTYR
jgi:broad specificity phosphatase PhoE